MGATAEWLSDSHTSRMGSHPHPGPVGQSHTAGALAFLELLYTDMGAFGDMVELHKGRCVRDALPVLPGAAFREPTQHT